MLLEPTRAKVWVEHQPAGHRLFADGDQQCLQCSGGVCHSRSWGWTQIMEVSSSINTYTTIVAEGSLFTTLMVTISDTKL